MIDAIIYFELWLAGLSLFACLFFGWEWFLPFVILAHLALLAAVIIIPVFVVLAPLAVLDWMLTPLKGPAAALNRAVERFGAKTVANPWAKAGISLAYAGTVVAVLAVLFSQLP